jgi:ectoine hydroxylase-related dioxygenase (phytanoyl-CoA dioxygenase family)
MLLTEKQLQFYGDNGYLLVTECFSTREIEQMKTELPGIFAEDSPRRVVEKDGHTVRSVYGSHMDNPVFRHLVRDNRLLGPSRQLLKDEAYVYQFKINAKAAFGGDVWEWHQDYIFWLKEDGMPSARAANVTVFLDDVTELNGPLFLVPGSHRLGVIDPSENGVDVNNAALQQAAYTSSPSWISNLTADLKYSLNQRMMAELIRQYGTVAPKGMAGSVLFFHPNVVHGSGNNISPFSRALALITYNSTSNAPQFPGKKRPEFLASSDNTPLQPVNADNSLSAPAALGSAR